MPDMHTEHGLVEHPIPVGRVVKALRLAAGLDQVACAEVLAISQGHLSRIERGQGTLALEPWAKGMRRLAVGVAPPEALHEDPMQRAWPLFLLAVPLNRSYHPGAVRLLAREDGRPPVFSWARSALFAAAVFGRMCSPEVCVIPIWPDAVSDIDARGPRPVVVPTPQHGLDLDPLQVNLDELDAATTIARAWLHENQALRAKYRKANASDFNKAIAAVGQKFTSLWSPPVHLPPDSLAIVDAAEKVTLWPPMD